MTSSSSSIASSTPATSANVVFGWSFDTVLCRLRPNCITRPPPPCERFITQSRTPAIRTTGRITVMSVLISVFGSCGSESYGTPRVVEQRLQLVAGLREVLHAIRGRAVGPSYSPVMT